MKVIVLAIGLVLGVGTNVRAQAPPASAAVPKAILDQAFYRAVLVRVYQLEKFADHLASRGKDPSYMRSKIRREGNLTNQEEQALKSAAREYIEKRDAFFRERSDLVKEAKVNAEAKEKVRARDKQDRDDLLAIVGKLRKTFGAARWEAYEALSRKLPANNVKVQILQKGGK